LLSNIDVKRPRINYILIPESGTPMGSRRRLWANTKGRYLL
jgi:hypothetical protein